MQRVCTAIPANLLLRSKRVTRMLGWRPMTAWLVVSLACYVTLCLHTWCLATNDHVDWGRCCQKKRRKTRENVVERLEKTNWLHELSNDMIRKTGTVFSLLVLVHDEVKSRRTLQRRMRRNIALDYLYSRCLDRTFIKNDLYYRRRYCDLDHA